MSAALVQLLRTRWFAASVHAGLWLLLYLVVQGLGGKTPEYRVAEAYSPVPQPPVPVTKLESLFSPNQWPKPTAASNVPNLFFTKFFVPPTPPPPPPPTTKNVEVTYQGFYQTGDSARNVIIRMVDTNTIPKTEGAFIVARIGEHITTNFCVAGATLQTLILTNSAAQTNLLSLNTNKVIEVPLK